MADYAVATRTKDFYQDQLLRDHPEIVSIAPRLKLDGDGLPTREAIIVIGVRGRNPLRLGVGGSAEAHRASIPSRLDVVDAQSLQPTGDSVEVVVEDEG